MQNPGISSQQVAGRPCHLCGERVLLEVEGRGCPDCDVAWHLACTETPALCPFCGKDVIIAARAVADAQKREVWKVLDRARTLYNILLILHILSTVALIIGISMSDDVITGPAREKGPVHSIIGAVFAFLIFFVFWLAAWFGKTAARWLLGITAWIPIILGILVFIGAEIAPDGFLRKTPVSRGTPRKGSLEAREAEKAKTAAAGQEKEKEKEFTFGQIAYLALVSGTAFYTIIICFFNPTLRNYEAALLSRRLSPP